MKMKRIVFVKIRPRFGELSPNDRYRDVLRLDCAFQSKCDPSIIAFPTFSTPLGDLGGTITREQWQSHSIAIDMLPAYMHMDLQRQMDPNNYVSYLRLRRNCDEHSRAILEPVTLAQYLTAKTIDDLDDPKK
jgi:hypothetical protein